MRVKRAEGRGRGKGKVGGRRGLLKGASGEGRAGRQRGRRGEGGEERDW